jgi:GNAT superfamily N-acetyltransferase
LTFDGHRQSFDTKRGCLDPRAEIRRIAAVLAAFDEQIRRHPGTGASGERVERDEAVVRLVGGGWSGVTWSALDEATADEQGVGALVRVHDEVFGGDHAPLFRDLPARLALRPAPAAAAIAVAGDTPVGAGRVEFHAGTEFASLWGDGTLPAWRGRGVFRSLVAHRAALAAARGFRYLQVDALPASRPLFERLGFVALATTTPFLHSGESA